MTRVNWDAVGSRRYELGVDHGMLYVPDNDGVPWNGLVSVEETPSGGEQTSYWLDGVKYLDTINSEDYAATITAFTYPDLFEQCQGVKYAVDGKMFAYGQPRQQFGFSYRTKIGKDTDPDYGTKIHLVYNAMVAPVQIDYATIDDSAAAINFAWQITAVPMPIPGMKPTAHVVLDTSSPMIIALIESLLYGDDDNAPGLPTPAQLVPLLSGLDTITITDNGDGTWTAEGSDFYITMTDAQTFEIDHATAEFISFDEYTISSG